MTILVSGLWHLGCVTAACLAEHFRVIAHDDDRSVVENLRRGIPPVQEPGLADLIRRGLDSGNLTFTNDVADASQADIVWVTHDTPVNERDESDVALVERALLDLLPHIGAGKLVIVSSQVPAGFSRHMEDIAYATKRDVAFAYLPENLRLGDALRVFRQPDRIIAGIRRQEDADLIGLLLTPFSTNIMWMSPESAEMTKHALNAFLATSITLINEIAGICESVGADVKAVELGLRSDARIGYFASLTAGSGFAGGTLARDLRTLSFLGKSANIETPVVDGVLLRNEVQQRWMESALLREIGTAGWKKIAILGLTYKAGTDTLRRSQAVDLALRLHSMNAVVVAYDPSVQHLPEYLARHFTLAADAESALERADAAVIATNCAEFQHLTPASFYGMKQRIVIDPQRVLEGSIGVDESIRYVGVGLPPKR